MPYGIYPVPKHRSPSDGGPTGPGLAVRIRTRLRRAHLDKQLAHGADPATSRELALRAEQLRTRTERARIANALVEALGDARRAEPITMRPRPQRAALRDAGDAILALALRLQDDQPVDTAGVAMAAWLAASESSPTRRDDAADLQEALQSALDALDAGQPRTRAVEARAA